MNLQQQAVEVVRYVAFQMWLIAWLGMEEIEVRENSGQYREHFSWGVENQLLNQTLVSVMDTFAYNSNILFLSKQIL